MTSGTTYKPGDLVLIPFPFSNLASDKKRPVLVLSTPNRHGDFVGLAITSVPTKDAVLPLDKLSIVLGTLPKQSWVRLDKVFTLETGTVVKKLGEVSTDFLTQVIHGMCANLGHLSAQ